LSALGMGSGILLTTGSGTPALNNSSPFLNGNPTLYGTVLGTPGDSDLTTIARSINSNITFTNDANTLQFSFNVVDPLAKFVSIDLAFGSEAYPTFLSDNFADVAAVWVNGINVGFFNDGARHPLMMNGATLHAGNFIDNSTGVLPIEYDGISSP